MILYNTDSNFRYFNRYDTQHNLGLFTNCVDNKMLIHKRFPALNNILLQWVLFLVLSLKCLHLFENNVSSLFRQFWFPFFLSVWFSWSFLRFHEILFQTDANTVSFLFWKYPWPPLHFRTISLNCIYFGSC